MNIIRPVNTKGQDPIISTGFSAGHPGVDYAYPEGTPWYFVADGEVLFAKDNETRHWIANNQKTDPFFIPGKIRPLYNEDYGNYVIVKHDAGYTSLYAHNKPGTFKFKVGDKVKKGQEAGQIGSTGNSTGNHLHFEVRLNGQKIQPGNIMDTSFSGYFSDAQNKPVTNDRRSYWFDLIRNVVWPGVPHEKITDVQVLQFVTIDYPSREARARMVDTVAKIIGYTGNTTELTAEKFIEIVRGTSCDVQIKTALQDQKNKILEYIKNV